MKGREKQVLITEPPFLSNHQPPILVKTLPKTNPPPTQPSDDDTSISINIQRRGEETDSMSVDSVPQYVKKSHSQ